MLTGMLAQETLKTIAQEAVTEAQRVYPAGCASEERIRDFLLLDEACFIAGRQLHAALVSLLGLAGIIAPFGYWERTTRPHVEAVLAADQGA